MIKFVYYEIHEKSRIKNKLGICVGNFSPVPEFIDPVITKTSPKTLVFSQTNERFGLVSGTAMEARNQVGIGLLYRPASLRSLATQFQLGFLLL